MIVFQDYVIISLTMTNSWDRYWGQESKGGYWSLPDKAVVNLFAQVDGSKVKDVLDIGCGIGRHAIYAAEAGHSVTAVDSSQEALNILKRLVDEKGFNIKIVRGQYSEDLFPGGCFDLVIAHNVIYHGSKELFSGAVCLIHKYLRPGGYFFFTCPTRRDAKYGNGEAIAPNAYQSLNSVHPGDVHYFADQADLVEFLREFRTFSTEVYEHYWDNNGVRQFSSYWQVTARK